MGQHKYNPTAQAAKEGKLSPKPQRMSKAERLRYITALIWEHTGIGKLRDVIEGKYFIPEPPRKIRTWEELDGLVSSDGRHRIEVDLKHCNGWILPAMEVPDSEYWKHHEYLSTHTFYENSHKRYTETLQKFGFNVELVSCG